MRLLPLLVGGFMGPFGTALVLPMFPELREHFDATTEQVSLSFSVYLFVMAAMMLFSGTIGERYGRRRVVRLTFVTYSVASLLCVAAPTLNWFLLARALQGAANAFITPLLLAGLAEVLAADKVGRAVGVYSSFQAFGGALSPFFGGFVAEFDWRWAFVASAVVALLLSLFPPPGEPRRGVDAPPIKALVSKRMLLLGAAAFTAALGPIGAAVLVGVKARDQLDLGPTQTGLLFLGFGLAAMVTGPAWGNLVERIGVRQSSLGGIGALIVLVSATGAAPSGLLLAACWIAVGAVTNLIVVILQLSAAIAEPDNRGGAVSVMLAFRFLGHATGPLLFVPVLASSVQLAFALAASVGVLTAAALVMFASQPARAATMAQ